MATATNPNYRVEHVATVPKGWRVRTKMQATHMLRIAFPPGARRKGSGKVIEIFHPVNENPCSQRDTILKRLVNPSTDQDMDQAAELYRTFIGKEPQKVIEMQESDVARKTYAGMAPLVSLILDSPAGEVEINFTRGDEVKLASSPSGTQIYFIGGNQNIDANLKDFGTDTSKDFVLMGYAIEVTYRARKKIDNFDLVDYYHGLGEETGDPPIAFYDRLKRRIFLIGGSYYIDWRGIIN